MWFDVVFVSLFLAGWLAFALVPWLIVSIRTRGEAGLLNLGLCLLAGVVAALLLPLLGMDDFTGLWLSFAAAFLASAALLAARRFSLHAPTPVPDRHAPMAPPE